MNKNTQYAVIGVIIVVVVAVAVGVYLYDDDETKEPSEVGSFAEYVVIGHTDTMPDATIEGTMSMEIISETSTQYEMRTIYNLYAITGETKTPFLVDDITAFEDKDINESYGVKQGSDTIDTKWGSVLVDVYLKTDSTLISTSYVGQEDERLYRLIQLDEGITLELNLDSTNL